jgi:ribosomal protein S18 acetylase RimI-like enzyme
MNAAALNQKERLHLRDARLDELDEVARLLREAYLEYQKFLTREVWEGYLQDIMNVRGRLGVAELIVAELGGELAGAVTLYLKTYGPQREMWPEGWAGVRLLAVRPSCRGRGIGRALMDECIRRCRGRGIRTVGLHTTVMMEVARGIYERMGFVRIPEYDFYPRPGVVVMAYKLDLEKAATDK